MCLKCFVPLYVSGKQPILWPSQTNKVVLFALHSMVMQLVAGLWYPRPAINQLLCPKTQIPQIVFSFLSKKQLRPAINQMLCPKTQIPQIVFYFLSKNSFRPAINQIQSPKTQIPQIVFSFLSKNSFRPAINQMLCPKTQIPQVAHYYILSK